MNPSPYHAPFKSAHLRATIVKILLIANAAAAGLSLLAEALSLAFPLTEDQELGDNPLGAIVVLIVLMLALIEFVIYLTTVVFFGMWLYRSYDNLPTFNAWARPDYSPGWAVGSFFVPIVNLVVPYRAVKEVWQKSVPPEEAHLSEPSPPATFPAWWLFWLLASFAANISFRVSMNENAAESTATMVSIVAGVLTVPAAFFAYLVVNSIDKRQEEAAAKLKLGQLSGPPPPPADLLMPSALSSTNTQ